MGRGGGGLSPAPLPYFGDLISHEGWRRAQDAEDGKWCERKLGRSQAPACYLRPELRGGAEGPVDGSLVCLPGRFSAYVAGPTEELRVGGGWLSQDTQAKEKWKEPASGFWHVLLAIRARPGRPPRPPCIPEAPALLSCCPSHSYILLPAFLPRWEASHCALGSLPASPERCLARGRAHPAHLQREPTYPHCVLGPDGGRRGLAGRPKAKSSLLFFSPAPAAQLGAHTLNHESKPPGPKDVL